MAHQVSAAEPLGAGTASSRPPRASEGRRLSFRVKVALVWLGIFALVGIFFALAKFDVAWMRENFRFIVTGMAVTIFVAVVSIFFAVVLALLGALGRLSRNSVAYGVTGFYTSFFRGTPLIVQLFLIYLALAQVGINLPIPASVQRYFIFSAVVAGIAALSLNYGAYMTEIFRAGILAVGPGQTEAADALGMTYRQRMRRVVLPQAFKIVIPPTGNEFIAMMKDTALIGFLGGKVFWYDIFKRAQVAGAASFKYLEALVLAAGMYWALTAFFTFFQSKLERRVSKGYVRQAIETTTRKTRWMSGAAAGGRGGGAMMVQLPDPEGELEAKHAEERAQREAEGEDGA